MSMNDETPDGTRFEILGVDQLIRLLIEQDNPPSAREIIEASVHLGTRSRTFTASFRDETGEQKWKSTGLCDRERAQRLALKWEAAARAKRLKIGHRPRKSGLGLGAAFTQDEVASLLHLSTRAVRAIERRALRKLASHPLLREMWQEYCGGELDESNLRLSAEEIAAVIGLARTSHELDLIKKVLDLVGW